MAETGKSFVKKFVGFSLVTWVTFVVNFLVTPISTRLFTPEVVGKINIFNTYTNLFALLILIGLDQAFARFYYERPNNKTIGYLLSFCFGISYAILSVIFIMSLPFRALISWELFGETDNLLLYLFFISLFCASTLRYLNLSYRMEQNIKMYTIQNVLWLIVSKILYLGVGFWDPSYKPALIVLTASHLLLVIVYLWIQRNRFEFIRGLDKRFSIEIMKFALPLVPFAALTWANTSIPQIVMQKTMDYRSIGIFTSAITLANVILVIQAGFNTLWVPYVYDNYKVQTGQFFKVHRYLLCALTICALLLVLFQDVVFLLLGEKFRAAKSFFPFLLLGPVCYTIGETTGVGIEISKKSYFNLIVFVCSILINILLCLILRFPFGISGIAMAFGCAGVTAMTLKTIIGQHFYHAIDSYRYIIITLLFLLTSALVTLYVDSSVYKNTFLFVLCVIAFLYYKREIWELKDYALSFIRK